MATRLVQLGSGLAATALAMVALVVGVGDHFERQRPQVSVRLPFHSADAVSRAAEEAESSAAVGGGDRVGLARRALMIRPVDMRAVRILAQEAGAANQTQQQARWMALVGARTWRDSPAQLWLMERALMDGRFDDAFDHADALARRRVDLQPGLFNLFGLAALDPRLRTQVLKHLEGGEVWRAAFLTSRTNAYLTPAALSGYAVELQRRGKPIDDEVLVTLLANLQAGQDLALAADVLAKLRPGLIAPDGLFDAHLEGRDGIAPFAWVRGNETGGSSEFGPAPDRQGNALRLSFSGFGTQERIAQFASLKPGQYRLSALARAEFKAAAPFSIRVSCAVDGRLISQLKLGPEVERWTAFETEFIVPDQCVGVKFAVWADLLDRQAESAIWLDELVLAKALPSS